MLNNHVPRATDIRVIRLDKMAELHLTFFCGQNAPFILGGPFAATKCWLTNYVDHSRGPIPVPFVVPLHTPAIEQETLYLEMRLNDDSFSMLFETRSLGVVHTGLQAKPTTDPKNNTFSLRYRVTHPQLLFLWKGRGGASEPTVSCAIYPEGVLLAPNHNPMVIGPQLSSFRPVFDSHRPAWSWAPLEHIRRIVVHERDVPGFIGMLIYYENGAQRYIGDVGRGNIDAKIRRRAFITPITRIYIETWPPSGQHTKMRVHFGSRGPRTCMHTEYKEHNLEGELHFWYGPWMTPELRVLPSGSWQA